MEVVLGPGHIVLDVLPSPKKGAQPPNSRPMSIVANGCMDQDATWYQVGLGPGHMVLDGDPAPLSKNRAQPPPQFLAHVCYGQTAGWIKMQLGTKVGLGPGHIVLH